MEGQVTLILYQAKQILELAFAWDLKIKNRYEFLMDCFNYDPAIKNIVYIFNKSTLDPDGKQLTTVVMVLLLGFSQGGYAA